MTTKIINGLLVNAGSMPELMDIVIKDGRITGIGKALSDAADEIIDATGMVVMPGLVDAHTHLREPGQEYKEDIASGTRAAAMGGITSVACMPNTKPAADSPEVIRQIIARAKAVGIVNVYPVGAMTMGLAGDIAVDVAALKAAGAVAISDDGRPVVGTGAMKKAIEQAHQAGIAAISHCEDLDLAEGGCMNEGVVSKRLGVKGIPTASEDLMVSRELILSEYTGLPVHVAHVSSKLSIDLIRAAKARGANVTAETCPHYFTLTDEACETIGADAKMNPPLRTETDRLAVIEGLRDGTLDIIATDHAPHADNEKSVGLEKAMNGIIGLETLLPLTYTHLVKTGVLSLSDMAAKLCLHPAEMLRLPKGELAVGLDADITIFDPSQNYTIDKHYMQSKSHNTPFHGMQVYGKVMMTMVGGKWVVRDGNLCNK